MTLFKNLMITVAGTAFWGVSAVNAASADATERTLFAPDISGSSVFLVEQYFANQAAEYVYTYIRGLKPPHDLRMISVGNTGIANTPIDVRAKITNRRASSAKRIAPQIAGHFKSLPVYTKRGVLKADGMTSLTAFFKSLKPICSSGNTRVIVFTDGVQWDSKIDGRDFMAGRVKLPKPTGTPLTGCHVEMLGVGQLKVSQNSDGLAELIIPQWEAWLEEAGAESVRVVGKLFAF
ncbi:MAG: hypothetical protein GY761_16460 [Hyphomicrobiales bacterium]|nr:hypothetical protein [Hyphomicrobiales bacterium]